MSGLSGVTSAFANGVTAPASTFANAVTPPSSSLSACATPPVSWIEECAGALPVLTSLSPASGRQGDSVNVTIVGTGFFPGATINVSGAGVTVSAIQVVSSTVMLATLAIDPTAAASARSITITTIRGTSGAQTFTVTTASRSSIWLDPSLSSSLTLVSGAISAAADISGNGNVMTQATAANRPALQAAAMNNLPAMRFDGVNDFLSMNWPSAEQLSGGSTLIIVCRPRFSPAPTREYPLARWMPSNASGMQAEGTADPAPGSAGRLEGFASTNVGLKRAPPVAVVDQVTRVHTFVVNPAGGGSLRLYRNGVLVASNSGFSSLSTTVGDLFCLGRDEVVSGNFGDYDIGEFRMFPSVLSDAERQAEEARLMAKWLDTIGTASRGPILLATQVIDGVTVDILTWADSAGDPDFKSIDSYEALTVIRFSEAIKRFRGTWVHGHTNPVSQPRLVLGVTNFVTTYSWTYVTSTSVPVGVDGWTSYLEDPTGTGFTHVVSRIVGGGNAGFVNPSVLKDCYFSKLGDP